MTLSKVNSNKIIKSIVAVILFITVLATLIPASAVSTTSKTETYSPITVAIQRYVTSLNGTHATPYTKGGTAMAYGCCAFVNEVWLNVFGKDMYDANPEQVKSNGVVTDTYAFLKENNAQPGDILWAFGTDGSGNYDGATTHYVIIHDYDQEGFWVSDGSMSSQIMHNNEYVAYDWYDNFYDGHCSMILYRVPNSLKSKYTQLPSDVSSSDWYAEAVMYNVSAGIMDGTSNNTFSPKLNLTRAMIVTILYSIEGKPAVSGSTFTDVGDNQYYSDPVKWASSKGIVSGIGNNKFGPTQNLSREQLATILYKYAQYKDYDVKAGSNLEKFDDVADIANWAETSMSWAVSCGILNGTGSGLSPKNIANRAQVAQIMMQFCKKYNVI